MAGVLLEGGGGFLEGPLGQLLGGLVAAGASLGEGGFGESVGKVVVVHGFVRREAYGLLVALQGEPQLVALFVFLGGGVKKVGP